MGKLGRAIDRLPRKAKDFLVREQNWVSGSGGEFDIGEDGDITGACVVGQVVRSGVLGDPNSFVREGSGGMTLLPGSTGAGRSPGLTKDDYYVALPGEEMDKLEEWGFGDLGPHYDRLCNRFGMDRIVRCIKLRAARGNRERVEELLDSGTISREEARRIENEEVAVG